MITEEQTKEIEYVKGVLSSVIKSSVEASEKVKGKLTPEVIVSVIYLKTFSSYIQETKIENIHELWKFMNDIKGIIEKVSYVNSYISRINESTMKS